MKIASYRKEVALPALNEYFLAAPNLPACIPPFGSVESVEFAVNGHPIDGRRNSDQALNEANQLVITINLGAKAKQVTQQSASGPSPVVAARVAAEVPDLQLELSAGDSLDEMRLLQMVSAYREAAATMRFVSIKWFRDIWVPGRSFDWVGDPELVQRILRNAIESGRLRKEQLPNPNNPDHPTTVLKEGNASSGPSAASPTVNRHFRPISLPGKPLSQMVIEGR